MPGGRREAGGGAPGEPGGRGGEKKRESRPRCKGARLPVRRVLELLRGNLVHEVVHAVLREADGEGGCAVREGGWAGRRAWGVERGRREQAGDGV